jgi:hypothetical protein
MLLYVSQDSMFYLQAFIGNNTYIRGGHVNTRLSKLKFLFYIKKL